MTGSSFPKARPVISPQRRNEIVDALRRGTVPRRSLDAFAVGLEAFETVVGEELASVAAGSARFKAVRGEVQDVLDRIDLHADFDPRCDYAFTLSDGELTDVERNARAATTPDDIELEP